MYSELVNYNTISPLVYDKPVLNLKPYRITYNIDKRDDIPESQVSTYSIMFKGVSGRNVKQLGEGIRKGLHNNDYTDDARKYWTTDNRILGGLLILALVDYNAIVLDYLKKNYNYEFPKPPLIANDIKEYSKELQFAVYDSPSGDIELRLSDVGRTLDYAKRAYADFRNIQAMNIVNDIGINRRVEQSIEFLKGVKSVKDGYQKVSNKYQSYNLYNVYAAAALGLYNINNTASTATVDHINYYYSTPEIDILKDTFEKEGEILEKTNIGGDNALMEKYYLEILNNSKT